MIFEGEDGVTHINIYSKGKTELGKWLSNFTKATIILTDDGKFDSIEGYWYWLLTVTYFDNRVDELRTLSGFKAKELGKQILSSYTKYNEATVTSDAWFIQSIKNALDVKLKTYGTKATLLAQSTLPLCHYYDYKGKKIDAGFEWLVEHFDNRRIQLQKYFGAKASA